jgi:hypothetical protein
MVIRTLGGRIAQRSRLRRLRGVSLGVSIGFFALFLLSGLIYVGYTFGSHDVAIGAGSLHWDDFAGPLPPSHLGFRCSWTGGYWAWRFRSDVDGKTLLSDSTGWETTFVYVLQVPLWMPLVFSLLVTSIIWVATRRKLREPVGLCRNCGFDLRGSPGPHCPACGVELCPWSKRHP